MSSAEVEKEKGNAAFKASDFATAVGHYSAAIIADRTDHTLPLNRAAAYLKLNKFEDAERDCTTVLSLPKGRRNVKALYRRSQARVAMGKRLEAENDLKEALRVEPNNELVKEEIEKLYMKESDRKKLASSTSTTKVNQTSKSTPTSKPYRRRVPIKLVESPAPGLLAGSSASSPASNSKKGSPSPKPSQTTSSPTDDPSPNHMEAVSTRVLSTDLSNSGKEASSPQAGPAPNPKTPSLSEIIPTREVNGKMVGGGIFRHPGSEALRKKTDPSAPIPAKFEGNANTNTKTSNEVASSSNKIATPAAPRDIPQPPLKPPASLFDFNKSWTTLPTPEGRWELLQHIPPTSLPNLFLTSLEPSMLVSILKDFISVLSTSPSESPKILEYMTNFPKVKRFSTIIMFLNREEAEVVQKVWSILRPNQKVGEDESKGWV